MTERLRPTPYPAYQQGIPRTVPRSAGSSDEGLSTKKTMLVLVVVVGCFAVLWPKLFYPMLVQNANSHIKPGPVDKTTGCCDVISEMDVETIKIMSQLCSTIIEQTGKTPPTPKEIVSQCRKAVLETCGIDISAALQDRISLGHSVKQILEEVRSLNGSLCLKYNFGVSPWRLGVPHRVNINLDPVNSIRQERPSHMRAGMVHPAFKERGRAIPETHGSTAERRSSPPPRIVEGRPGPIPGMRPAMGGAGHVVPPSKQTNYGFMGVLMPIYTVGFVIFFSYTIMKLVFKKKPDAYVGAPLYPPCESDEQFHKDVFEANRYYFNRPNKDTSKIGWKERDARDEELDQLRKRLRETELAMERIVDQMAKAPLATQDEIRVNGSLPKEEEQGSVTVMGMETTASSESGKKWSRPDSPVLPHPHPAPPKEPSPPPQQIFLEGALPPQSQILVADSATETQKDPEDDSPVVLAGKMTLSVISLDSDESSNSGKKSESPDDERRTSSSNISEEFEKINAADLEEQINDIIEEAENIALAEEKRASSEEEEIEIRVPDHQILMAPQINEKEAESEILEEIKNQFNLEDDLLEILKEKQPEGKVDLPVTDIIKEFLSSEEKGIDNIEERLADLENITSEQPKEEDINIQVEKTNEDIQENLKLENETPKELDEESKIFEEQVEEDNLSSMADIVKEFLSNEENAITDEKLLEKVISELPKEEEHSKEVQALSSEESDKSQTENVEELEKVTEDIISEQLKEEEQSEKIETNVPVENKEDLPLQEKETIKSGTSETENKEPEENIVRNIADVLLQGLVVKEDDNPTFDEASVVESQNDDEATSHDIEDQSQVPKVDIANVLLQGLVKEDDGPTFDEASVVESQNDDEATSHDVEDQSQVPEVDVEERVVEDVEYESEDEEEIDEDELREGDEVHYEDRSSAERRLNGDDGDSSRNGAANSETAAENEISEDDLENDDEEIEEIIEYVDNTDDEGEEIVEINGNEHRHLNEN